VAKSLKNIENLLDGLEKKAPGSIDTNSVEVVLIEWGAMFIQECRANLRATKSINSGALSSNEGIRPTVENSNGVYTLSVTLLDYYDFLNKGVRGVKESSKAPGSPYSYKTLKVSYDMMGSIRKWMIRKNLQRTLKEKTFKPRKPKTFAETSNSAAYAMAVGIKKKGIKATHFFDKALDKVYPELAPMLAKALSEDVVAVIKNINVVR
jgi:hypothetical protein